MSTRKILSWTIIYALIMGGYFFYSHKNTPKRTTIHKLDTMPTATPINCSINDLKYIEMLDVIVHVDNWRGSGSGILINRTENKDGSYTYYILTNWHVVEGRKTERLEVDGIRGKSEKVIEDPGIIITIFSDGATLWTEYAGSVLHESQEYDLAIATFETQDYLSNIASLASPHMIENVKIFDEVYAVGCQLGRRPIPTMGIISAIINTDEAIGFSHSAQIAPGSSGGGLFKEYGGHYYLIGVPNSVALYQFQILPHYAYAISMELVYRFLDENDLSCMYIDSESTILNELQNTG